MGGRFVLTHSGVMVYLSKENVDDIQIVTAKSSAMNIQLPAASDDHDPVRQSCESVNAALPDPNPRSRVLASTVARSCVAAPVCAHLRVTGWRASLALARHTGGDPGAGAVPHGRERRQARHGNSQPLGRLSLPASPHGCVS